MDRVKELETELKIVKSQIYVTYNTGSGLHARHNKFLKRYVDIVNELERISWKWKLRKFLKKLKRILSR